MKKIVTDVDTLIEKIKAGDYNECVDAVASFYDSAYRRGYDAGINDAY